MNIRSILAAAAVAAIVCPAVAQQADDAKAALMESAKAMREVQNLTFESKRFGTGMLKDFIDCDGTVMLWRQPGGKAPTVMVTGRIKQPGAGDKRLTYTSDGATSRWLEQKDNKLYERPATDTLAIQEQSLAKQLVPDEYTSAEPFAQVLKMEKLTKLAADTVLGEPCDIIEGSTADGSRTITWAISTKDRLPRRMEMATGQGEQKLSMVLEMKNFDTSKKFTAKDFDIPLPTGYIVDKSAPAAAPAMPGQPNVPAAEIGVAAGTAAPSVTVKDADGNEFAIDSMKGNVVVLEFFGTMFKASNIGSLDLQSLASGDFKGKNVKFIGMACREPNDNAAKEYFKNNGLTYTLVPKGDAAVDPFKVKGFPSYVVLNPRGEVASFFQTWPGKDVMSSAITQAMEAK
jgi:peroxiredoxin/outer membrane lipoprotein-sorting protein